MRHVDRGTELTVGEHRIAYRKQGEGPNLVFVHGWPLHRETWRNVADGLPGYTCHLFDLPSAGLSSSPHEPLTFEQMADLVVKLIDQLGLGAIGLVAHDSGGLIARLVAARLLSDTDLGTSLKGLVISGSEIPGRHPFLLDFYGLMTRVPGIRPVFAAIFRSRLLTKTPLVLGGAFADRSELDGEFRRIFIEPLVSDRARLRATLRFFRAFGHGPVDALAKVHPQILVPTLGIWGKDDPFFPVDRARAMMEQFGGRTEFVVLEPARLLVHEERPLEFANECDRFFGTVLI